MTALNKIGTKQWGTLVMAASLALMAQWVPLPEPPAGATVIAEITAPIASDPAPEQS